MRIVSTSDYENYSMNRVSQFFFKIPEERKLTKKKGNNKDDNLVSENEDKKT